MALTKVEVTAAFIVLDVWSGVPVVLSTPYDRKSGNDHITALIPYDLM